MCLTYNITLLSLSAHLGVSYSSLMRWKQRLRSGKPPVEPPGPRKVSDFDLDRLKNEIRNLKHGRKRTAETCRLYERNRMNISRRELNMMIAEARKRYNQDFYQIIWHHPGVVWAIDGSEVPLEDIRRKLHLCNVQDLCSKYKYPPLMSSGHPCGEGISGHLSKLFSEFGAPLFLKKDNGSNLNHISVDHTLQEYMVISLNSPPTYAPYNGSIEHANGEFKIYLKNWSHKAETMNEFKLLAEIAAHDLNHKARRILQGRNSCTVNFGHRVVRFDRRKRKEVFECIKNLFIEILAKLGDKGREDVAWRIAVRRWLQMNGFLTIFKNGKVLPH